MTTLDLILALHRATEAVDAAHKALRDADPRLAGWRVRDHRGEAWGVASADGDRAWVFVARHGDMMHECADRGIYEVDGVSVAIEWDPECGDGLYLFSPELRDDAAAKRAADAAEAEMNEMFPREMVNV